MDQADFRATSPDVDIDIIGVFIRQVFDVIIVYQTGFFLSVDNIYPDT